MLLLMPTLCVSTVVNQCFQMGVNVWKVYQTSNPNHPLEHMNNLALVGVVLQSINERTIPFLFSESCCVQLLSVHMRGATEISYGNSICTHGRLLPNQAAMDSSHTYVLDHPKAGSERWRRLQLAQCVILTPLHPCKFLQTQSSWVQQAEGIERRGDDLQYLIMSRRLTKFGANTTEVSQ